MPIKADFIGTVHRHSSRVAWDADRIALAVARSPTLRRRYAPKARRAQVAAGSVGASTNPSSRKRALERYSQIDRRQSRKAQRMCSRGGQVDDPATHERSAVVDGNNVTTTERPLFLFVTRTFVPNGKNR